MARVLIPLAQGCEELEAVTVIDLLRRAQIEVISAGLEDGPVRGSRDTVLVPDTILEAVMDQEFDMIVLPGGLPGSQRLNEDERISAYIVESENFESIHNHSAYALIERDKKTNPRVNN